MMYNRDMRNNRERTRIMKKNKSTISNNLYFLKMIWNISPSRVIHTFLTTLLDFAAWAFFSVVFVEYLFGSGAQRTFTEVLLFIWCVVLGSIALDTYLAWFKHKLEPTTNAEIHRSLNLILFKKAQSVDLSCYENPEFYNSYTKAATEAADRASAVLTNCARLVSSFLAFTYVVTTMCRITLWSIIFIVLPFFTSLYLSKKISKVNYDMNMEVVPHSRCMDYVNRVVYFRKYAGELRLTNIFQRLRKMYITALDNTVNIELKYSLKRYVLCICQGLLRFPFAFQGMWGCGALLAIKGEISLSDFVVLSSAIVSVSWMIMGFSDAVSNSFSNSLLIDNLINFSNYIPKIDENAQGKHLDSNVESIEFRNVIFTYPGQGRPALENVSLTMKKGVKHALVGINGSGKSTLIKLMLRFYDPTEGEILLNGVDIREFDIKEYRKLIGVAFQDFALFSSSVADNVLLKETTTEDEKEKVQNALKNSGVWEKISSLENGPETILTKEFDQQGVELSGGERQKIAIARAFAKDSPIVILDEPSSALDPVAESKMFETIHKLCDGKNKISVIVSHRLSSAAACDKIFMFENGVLLEEGSHNELMKENRTYAAMFKKQAENYLVETGGVIHG